MSSARKQDGGASAVSYPATTIACIYFKNSVCLETSLISTLFIDERPQLNPELTELANLLAQGSPASAYHALEYQASCRICLALI